MAVDPTKLIAAISSDTYCRKDKIKEVKSIIKSAIANKAPDPYLKAADKAELPESDFIDFDEVTKTPFQLSGIKNPIEQHSIEYDTSAQALEQVYFSLHDYLLNTKSDYGSVEKILDNFISAPGSAHFSEMGQRATKMQEEGMKILGVANQLIKTILNIIYDLKEFKLRLAIYEDYRDKKDKTKSDAAYLSLKQIWLDQVDIKRGNSSIKALAVSGQNQPNFVMLIDAFMYMNSLEDLKKKDFDINDRIRRLLEQRYTEFERWLKESERELKKRFEIEKIYLQSQLNSVKLYSRWAKPYLKAAAQLEQRGSSNASLVSLFNTSLFELTLLGIGEYSPEGDIARGELPKSFKGTNKRKYAPVVLVELKFRSIPERFQQQGGYGFRGKAEIRFTSFALNSEERDIFKDQLEWDDFKDVYRLVGGATDESLGQLQSDIDEVLGLKKEEKKSENSGSSEDTNPFSALFSIFTNAFKKSANSKEGDVSGKLGSIHKEKSLEIKPDSAMEKIIRSQAGLEARRRCRKFYDSFKKSNNSPAF